jgi:hypothetical protein
VLQAGQVCVFKADKEDAKPDKVLLAQVQCLHHHHHFLLLLLLLLLHSHHNQLRRILPPAAAPSTRSGGFTHSLRRATLIRRVATTTTPAAISLTPQFICGGGLCLLWSDSYQVIVALGGNSSEATFAPHSCSLFQVRSISPHNFMQPSLTSSHPFQGPKLDSRRIIPFSSPAIRSAAILIPLPSYFHSVPSSAVCLFAQLSGPPKSRLSLASCLFTSTLQSSSTPLRIRLFPHLHSYPG